MIATTNTRHDAGIRKAAVFISSLDQDAADLLLDQLGSARADLVRRAVMDLEDLDADEQQRVFEEFRRIGPMVPDRCPPGIELDRPPDPRMEPTLLSIARPAELTDGPTADDACEPNNAARAGQDAAPFGFLREAEEEKLAQLLGGERPQIIALVLSHLPPERAGEVLARFAPQQQVEVVRRLVDLENADPETLRDVEQALEARLSRQFAVERQRTAGPAAVARILASCDSRVLGSILENVATYDRSLAERLGCRPFDFDELVQLDDASLRTVFEAAEPAVAEAALLGAPPQLVERLLRGMAPEEARRMRGRLDQPGPIRLSDVEDARRQFALLAQHVMYRNSSRTAFAA